MKNLKIMKESPPESPLHGLHELHGEEDSGPCISEQPMKKIFPKRFFFMIFMFFMVEYSDSGLSFSRGLSDAHDDFVVSTRRLRQRA